MQGLTPRLAFKSTFVFAKTGSKRNFKLLPKFDPTLKARDYLSPSEYFFNKSYEKLEQYFESVRLLKTIKVLKDSVQLLVNENVRHD